MNIIDHLSLGVPDIEKACQFYDGLMATIGCSRLANTDGFAAYGTDAIQFLTMLPENGQASTAGNGVHICFVAASQEAVKNFHAYAVANGGACAGEPGPRPGYPLPEVFTTFVHDPFGNKLEAIHQSFAA